MKTAETKTGSSSHLYHAGQPFFQKEGGEGTFFSASQTGIQAWPFFNMQAVSPFIQTKLTIGQPGDRYEQEADDIADRLYKLNSYQTQSLSSVNSGTHLLQSKCAECDQEERLQKEENYNSSESNTRIQKKTRADLLQRQATEKDPCPNYEKGEIETSHTQKGHLNSDVFFPTPFSLINRQGDLILADFGVDWGSVKESAKNDPVWQKWRSAFENNPEYSLEIIGYSDCTGVEKHNDFLRKRRATKVFQLLDKARARVASYSAAPENDYLIDNANSYGRAVNRGVAIHFSRTFNYEPDIIEVEKKKPKPKIKPEKVDTDDCDKTQVDALARAQALAIKMVRAALGEVDNEVLMKKYFGKDAMDHQFHIHKNFISILDGLKWGPTFECEESDSWWCDGAVARVLPIIGLNIHICPTAIENGDDYLARTLVHEAGHGFAFIFMPDDLCEGGWSGTTTDAEDNADCYGEFAGEAFKL